MLGIDFYLYRKRRRRVLKKRLLPGRILPDRPKDQYIRPRAFPSLVLTIDPKLPPTGAYRSCNGQIPCRKDGVLPLVETDDELEGFPAQDGILQPAEAAETDRTPFTQQGPDIMSRLDMSQVQYIDDDDDSDTAIPGAVKIWWQRGLKWDLTLPQDEPQMVPLLPINPTEQPKSQTYLFDDCLNSLFQWINANFVDRYTAVGLSAGYET